MMVNCSQLADVAMVEIRTGGEELEVYGARLRWSMDGSEFRPCAIFRGRGADELLECTFYEWHQAVGHGNVKWDGRPRPVYWNLYLDDLHLHQGPVAIRVEAVVRDQVHLREQQVELVLSQTLFLDDWQSYIGGQPGWEVDDAAGLTVEPGAEVSPLRVPMPAAGRYDVYVGIPHGNVTTRLKMSEDAYHDAPVGAVRAEFLDKVHKEIRWKTAELRHDAALELSLSFGALRSPDLYPLGSIRYLKLVPVTPPERRRPKWDDRTLALHTEPYGLETRAKVKEVVEQLRDFAGTRLVAPPDCRELPLGEEHECERCVRPALMAAPGSSFRWPPGPGRRCALARSG